MDLHSDPVVARAQQLEAMSLEKRADLLKQREEIDKQLSEKIEIPVAQTAVELDQNVALAGRAGLDFVEATEEVIAAYTAPAAYPENDFFMYKNVMVITEGKSHDVLAKQGKSINEKMFGRK